LLIADAAAASDAERTFRLPLLMITRPRHQRPQKQMEAQAIAPAPTAKSHAPTREFRE
jgi:hypothetical protein